MERRTSEKISGKKKILLILGAFFIIAASAAAYLWLNPQILVTEKTVRLAGEQMGFNMDDAEIFREQLRSEIEKINWQSLGPDEKKEYFEEFINPGHLRMAVPAITRLPDAYREEAVNQAAALIRDYGRSLTSREKSELERYLNTSEGKSSLRKAERYITTGLSYNERATIAPVIKEFKHLVTEIPGVEFQVFAR